MNGKRDMVALCHPDRKHLSKNMCSKCYWAKHRTTNKAAYVSSLLKHRYGLSLEQYNELAMKQNHKCAICKKIYKRRRLCVDHNHKTGVNRGLLCDSCNKNVGVFEIWSNKIIEYLRRYQ